MTPPVPDADRSWTPRWPTLTATAVFSLWVAILALPMLAGKFLAGPWSDQYAAGYAFRTWGAEWWRRLGHVPLWEPEMFGGLPFVAAQHGDIFYPTSFLRVLGLSMPAVMHLNFVLHIILAGLFVYWLLRLFGTSWAAAVTGGVAYQLTGLVASYPLPGHDGKLIVSTMLPLAMVGLVKLIRDRRAAGGAILAAAVALALLSPHFQTTYYLLIASGIFALYLAFADPQRPATVAGRWTGLAWALGGVLLGFGVPMLQLLPFIHYLPFSPRSTGLQGGYEQATTYALPWVHLPELLIKSFTGNRETYWGPNGLKLHSEYLGLPVIALAALAFRGGQHRRLVLWLGGIALLFLLVSMGSSTPFYRLWWLLPYVKSTRAPGMAFFVVGVMVAVLAGLGMDRVLKGGIRAPAKAWLIAAGVIAALGAIGAFGALASGFSDSVRAAMERQYGELGMRQGVLDRITEAAQNDAGPIRLGAITGALALAAIAGLFMGWERGRVKGIALALGVPLIVGADLWVNARNFWQYSESPAQTIFKLDPVTERLKSAPLPYRVLDGGVYPTQGVTLMAHDIPAVLGHHAFELHRYDQLLGGQNEWAMLARSQKLWELLALNYVIVPAGRAESLPGFTKALANVPTSAGNAADLFARTTPAPWVRVVAGAIKQPDEAVVSSILDPRMEYDRLVVLADDAPVTPTPITALPEPSNARASLAQWLPGSMTIRLDPAPSAPAYVFVSENWYPDWTAKVDGRDAVVARANYTFMAVPVPAGAREVTLTFTSKDYRQGKAVSFASLAGIILIAVLPVLRRRRATVTTETPAA